MSQVWYFARNDQERGPFTETQMRTLVSAGKLRDDDLVWKEGTNEWVPAAEASELQLATETPRQDASDSSPETREAIDAPTPPPEPPLPKTPATAAYTSDVARESSRTARAIAYLLIAIGFLGVLASKGFESLTSRNVERLQAIIALEQSEFEKNWDAQIAALDAERRELQAPERYNGFAQSRINEINANIERLTQNRDVKRDELETSSWRERRAYARDAEQHEKVWAFWRQLAFIAATTIFCAGLLVMGLIGETAERSISLLIMGVIAYSLFMGGAAWQ